MLLNRLPKWTAKQCSTTAQQVAAVLGTLSSRSHLCMFVSQFDKVSASKGAMIEPFQCLTEARVIE